MDMSRDLKNAGIYVKAWDTLASDRNLWHDMTQRKNVHCNAWGCGYAPEAELTGGRKAYSSDDRRVLP